ncbi:coenzyme F420-0:L-glutamate ligase [Solicola sp. PLA-1-18]|uniref:coenzyme F420-0:L-glutamate ligase n=1 Tax=Solicola sp. PLA-1-18 TaxID=3380532 RepID=UPI003B77F2C4
MTLEVVPARGFPEVAAGDDLAALAVRHLPGLRDGDVVVVTSKVVSKAAGLVVPGDRADLLDAETDRVVAARGPLRIVRTHHGLVLAAGGIDRSNTAVGTAVPLPRDPDGDARTIRRALHDATGATVAVVVTDTAGRAWREGQVDLAIGAAGLLPLLDLSGTTDPHGNDLQVTAPAVADEVASAADLVAGKLAGVPVVLVRGLDPALLTADDGPGAAALVRAEDTDLFGLGAVDAVRAAVRRDGHRGFPVTGPGALESVLRDASEGTPVELRAERDRVEVVPASTQVDALVEAGAVAERVRVLAAAHRLAVEVVVTT